MEIHATDTSAISTQKTFSLPVEKRITELYQKGKTPIEIAKALNISIKIVQTKLNDLDNRNAPVEARGEANS